MDDLRVEYSLLDQASKKQKNIYKAILVTAGIVLSLLIAILSTKISSSENTNSVALLLKEKDSLMRVNEFLKDSLDLMINESLKLHSAKNVIIFSNKLPIESSNLSFFMTKDGTDEYEIRLDTALHSENISKIVYIYGLGENEQVSSVTENFIAQFKTKKDLGFYNIKILVFYKNGEITIWKPQ